MEAGAFGAHCDCFEDCDVCTRDSPVRDCDEMYTDERADEGISGTAVTGRARMSSTAGEMLREEGAVRKEEVVDAGSVCCNVLGTLVLGLWEVEGRREGSRSAGGEAGLLGAADEMLAVGVAFIDIRWAASAFRSWLICETGRCASEAERVWKAIASTFGLESCSSTTLGRPTNAYDTMTAMSQLRPFSQREMDIVRALHSFAASWITASS